MTITIDQEDSIITVRLSRRNLCSLLAKLDGYPPDSYCTIFKDFRPFVDWSVIVTAEEDPDTAGDMHPFTERRMMAVEKDARAAVDRGAGHDCGEWIRGGICQLCGKRIDGDKH